MIATPLVRRKPSTARLKHREQMRTDILKAARELISAQGVDGLTMRRLGKRVGVTAATLYGYYPAKESVLQALLDEKLDAMNTALWEAAANAQPGVTRLLAFARGYRHFALTHPDYYQMFIFNLDPPDWDLLASGARPQDEVLSMLHREIRETMERGDLVQMDVNMVLRLLWASAHGYVTLELTNCFGTNGFSPEDREALYMEHMETLLRGFTTPQRVAKLDFATSSTP